MAHIARYLNYTHWNEYKRGIRAKFSARLFLEDSDSRGAAPGTADYLAVEPAPDRGIEITGNSRHPGTRRHSLYLRNRKEPR